MAIRVFVTGPRKRSIAGVGPEGYLRTGPVAYSDSATETLAVNNQGYTLIEPRAGMRAIIGGYILDADRNVGANGALVEIYEANEADSATVSRSLFAFDIIKQTTRNGFGLNLAVSPSVWINAKTDDNNVRVTLLYYFVETNGTQVG